MVVALTQSMSPTGLGPKSNYKHIATQIMTLADGGERKTYRLASLTRLECFLLKVLREAFLNRPRIDIGVATSNSLNNGVATTEYGGE